MMTDQNQHTIPDRSPVKKWAKIRLWAGYIYLLAALFFSKPILITACVGLILVFYGIYIRMLATSALTKDKELCSSGLYGATRNPLYLGSSLIGLGIAFVSGSWWIFAGFFLILVPLYMRMILLEEKYLSELFPDTFQNYMKSVPRFFPRMGMFLKNQGKIDFNKLGKTGEIMSSALILIALALILFFHRSWLMIP
jgi:protein-S-isoprenylcysteine O-methyltransferase Ste14